MNMKPKQRQLVVGVATVLLSSVGLAHNAWGITWLRAGSRMRWRWSG
jgi:hypothetical protein